MLCALFVGAVILVEKTLDSRGQKAVLVASLIISGAVLEPPIDTGEKQPSTAYDNEVQQPAKATKHSH